jgi:hypothetical protein
MVLFFRKAFEPGSSSQRAARVRGCGFKDKESLFVTGFGAQALEKVRPAPKAPWRRPAWPQAWKAPGACELQ